MDVSKKLRFRKPAKLTQQDGTESDSRNGHASLSTSRSTPSLPALVNYALSATASLSKKRAELSSLRMQLASSHHSSTEETDTPRAVQVLQYTMRRRNSFSSFLTTKYGRSRSVSAARLSNSVHHTAPQPASSELQEKSKKGHRPRSFSETPAMTATVERAPPVATTNKTPIYEYYGFVMYLASFVAFGIYLIWAYVPDEILHNLGITYYPKRYWALAIPTWLVTLVWFIFISFMSINLMNTAPLDSYMCITDEYANVMSIESDVDRPEDWMPELHDIPISVANAFLYQSDHDKNTSEKFTL